MINLEMLTVVILFTFFPIIYGICSSIYNNETGCAETGELTSLVPLCNPNVNNCEYCYYACDCKNGYYAHEFSYRIIWWGFRITHHTVSICEACNINYCNKCNYYETDSKGVISCDECEPPFELEAEEEVILTEGRKCKKETCEVTNCETCNSLNTGCTKCAPTLLIAEKKVGGWGSLMECMDCPEKCQICDPTETTCDCKPGTNYSPPCNSCLDDPARNCASCDLQDHSSCTACILGYEYIASDQSCKLLVCSDPNCHRCLSGECAQCKIGYVLNDTNNQCINCSALLGLEFCIACSPTKLQCTKCLRNKLLVNINNTISCHDCPNNCDCDGTAIADCEESEEVEEEVEEEEDKPIIYFIEKDEEKKENKGKQRATIILIVMGLIIIGLIIFAIVIQIIRSKRKTTKITDRPWIVSEKENVMMNTEKDPNKTPTELMPICSICLETISQPKLGVLCCGHSGFHTSCIEHWVKLHKTCPLCRATILV